MAAEIEVKSEVTGAVWKIVTEVGQSIEAGTAIMILESMKMEIPVIAEDDGTIARFLVMEGEPIHEGQVVAILTR